MGLQSSAIELGMNRRGKPVNSCVVVPADLPNVKPTAKGRLTDNDQFGVSMLRRALSKQPVPLPCTSDYPQHIRRCRVRVAR